MNGFLVIACYTFDDLPIGLFDDYDEAMQAARSYEEEQGDEVAELFGRDGPSDCAINCSVVEFKDGVPCNVEVL